MADRPHPAPLALEPTLPRDAYVSSEQFAVERERIFAREWVLVGREESVPARGDYLAVDLLGESILVVRDEHGALNALFNVCRHRGSTVIAHKHDGATAGVPVAGHAGTSLRCPYHSWTYALDGSLRATPFMEAEIADRKHEFGLHRAGLATWGGFVFLNLEPEAAAARGHTLEAQFGECMQRLRNYPLAELRTGHRIVYDVAANWKVILENYNECYHCSGVHPELCRLVPSFRETHAAPLAWEQGIRHRDGAVTFTASGRTTRAPFPGLDAHERVRHKGELIYPNLMLSASMDHIAAFTLLPRDAAHTTVICDFLFHPTEIAKSGFNPMDAVEFWDLVNRQDWTICEGVQRGMNSRRFTHGYYAPMENASLDIRRYVAERVEGHASGPNGRGRERG